MSFKFKEGDLVEVINSNSSKIGHRFIIGRAKMVELLNQDGSIYSKTTQCYESDIISPNGGTRKSKFRWSPECDLKLVNPDIDDIADSTFSEIMDEITEAITVEQ